MKHLFLTSSVQSVAHDIAKKLDLSSGNTLVFITTPVEPKEEQGDLQWLADDRQSLVDAGFQVTDYTITGKTKNELLRDLDRYDYIYMSGGDTFYLLYQSQQTGFIDVVHDLILKQNKTYIGTSAGSIITGVSCPDYLLSNSAMKNVDNKFGYGFVPFIILPHWGSVHFRKKYLGSRLELAYKEDQYPLVALTDSQYIHVQDDRMTFVDVKRNEDGQAV